MHIPFIIPFIHAASFLTGLDGFSYIQTFSSHYMLCIYACVINVYIIMPVIFIHLTSSQDGLTDGWMDGWDFRTQDSSSHHRACSWRIIFLRALTRIFIICPCSYRTEMPALSRTGSSRRARVHASVISAYCTAAAAASLGVYTAAPLSCLPVWPHQTSLSEHFSLSQWWWQCVFSVRISFFRVLLLQQILTKASFHHASLIVSLL